MSKVEFIEKPFEELTVEEFRSMMRGYGTYSRLDSFLQFYGINMGQYWDYVRGTKGIAIVDNERTAYREWAKVHRPVKSSKEQFTGAEMKGFRMLRGLNTHDAQKLLLMHSDKMKEMERRKNVPGWVADRYISALKISKNEINRLRMYLARQTKGFEIERSIPTFVKEKVRIRDKGKCTNCGSGKKLHFHHKEHFAKGGLHIEDNILLLCANCHAEEHKGEQSYWLLKRMAEGDTK